MVYCPRDLAQCWGPGSGPEAMQRWGHPRPEPRNEWRQARAASLSPSRKPKATPHTPSTSQAVTWTSRHGILGANPKSAKVQGSSILNAWLCCISLGPTVPPGSEVSRICFRRRSCLYLAFPRRIAPGHASFSLYDPAQLPAPRDEGAGSPHQVLRSGNVLHF